MKLLVQVWRFPKEIAAVDAFTAELSQQSDGAAFSRAEALRIAAMEWLQEHQASPPGVPPAPPPRAPAATPEREAAAAPAAPAPGPGVPPPPASRRARQSSGADPGGPHGRGDAGAPAC